MRKRAFVDIAILALVFWSIWSLRFAEVQNVGLWSILAAVGAGAALMAMRKESWRDIGLRAGGDARFVLSRAGEFSILALVTGFAVIGIQGISTESEAGVRDIERLVGLSRQRMQLPGRRLSGGTFTGQRHRARGQNWIVSMGLGVSRWTCRLGIAVLTLPC